jgi:hypothetical protein
MALPYGTTGSLCPTFVPDRLVGLTVKHPYAITLYARLPIVLRVPLKASVTLLEATTPVKLPTKHCPPKRVRFQINKGWYFKVDSTTPGGTASSLPPILHIIYPKPMLSYSEGSRGLSVPLRVNGIFTVTTISPSSWLRQCPDRYTIRAGRNLPDKEFRYLRTVIVTAAVYRGFSSSFSEDNSPLNLPAPGRCQALYFIFRFCKAMCFW